MNMRLIGLIGCLGLAGCGAGAEAEELGSSAAALGPDTHLQDASPYWVDLYNRHGEPARRLRQRIFTSTHVEEGEEEGEEGGGTDEAAPEHDADAGEGGADAGGDEHGEGGDTGEEEPGAGELRPIRTPTGHHLRLGEFSRVQGRSTVKCRAAGSHIELELSDLIPSGTYSLWNVLYEDPGYDGQTERHIIGFGALGNRSGNENVFKADAHGRAKVRLFNPAGPLSLLGSVGACPATEAFDWLILGVYHLDPFTGGPRPGGIGSGAGQFAFDYAN